MKSAFISEDETGYAPATADESVGLDALFDLQGSAAYDTIFRKATAETLAFLEKERASRAWCYRGVDLLWCHKLILFENRFNAMLCRSALEQFLASRPDTRIIVERRPYTEIWSTPLWRVIESCQLGSSDRVHFAEARTAAPPLKPARPARLALKDALWPAQANSGDWSRVRYLMYSDPDRSESVLNSLGNNNCGVYTRHRAPALWLKSRKAGTAYWQDVRSAHDDISVESYRAIIGARAVPAAYHGLLMRIVNEHFIDAMDAVDAAERLLDAAPQLRSVLLDEDISAGKNAFCQAAKQRGIRTAVECHGALADPRGFWPLTADRLFAWGEAQRAKLIEWGVPAERVLVTGCSRYERYQRMSRARVRGEVCRALKLDGERPLILLSLFPIELEKFFFRRTVMRTLKQMLDLVSEIPEAQFLLKLHPGDMNTAWYERWLVASGAGARVRLIKQYDPMLLAIASDVMVVYHSTYAIDGLAMDKPVILVDDGHMRIPVDECEKFGAFVRARDSREMSAAAKIFLAQPEGLRAERARTREHCLNERGGIPAERIAEALASERGTPRVSIVLGTFNGEKYLKEQLDSLRSQTMTDWELIVTDDGSTDRTLRIAEEAAATDARIRIVAHKKNRGVAKNFLSGLALARGQAVAYCDQDDVWRPDKLQSLLQLLDSDPECSLAHSDLELQNEAMAANGRSFHRSAALKPLRGSAAEKALLKNTVPGCAMLFTRRAADAVLCVEPHASFLHDHLTLAVAAGMGRIRYTPKRLVRYRQHPANRIGTRRTSFDRKRFAEDLTAKIACLRKASLPNYRADLDGLERFACAYAGDKVASRIPLASHFMYLRNDRAADKALGLVECLFPRWYQKLRS